MRRHAIRAGVAGFAVVIAFLVVALNDWSHGQDGDPAAAKAAASKAAFRTVARVLRNPRCLNCHTNTDYPRVGDDREPHPQNVKRGPDDHGVPGLRCSACHRDANQDLVGVPGAPKWALAPLSMGWEKLDDHELAEALKDKAKNGNRSLAQVLHHLDEDPLVLWAWSPGEGRDAPPISHAEFMRAFREWMTNGAVSPDPGFTSH